jgi:nucleotide-binding universal stress UspA family protein
MDSLTHFPPREVLAPTDLSDISNAALAYARLFHERFGSRLTVLHAESLEAPPYFTRDQADELLARARAMRQAALEHLEREAESVLGFRPSARVVEGPAPRAILSSAREISADLIVMGSHGRGAIESVFIGSVTERVVRQAGIPVLAAPPGPAASFRHILYQRDPGTASQRAQRYAAALAESFESRLSIADEEALKRGEVDESVDLVVLGVARPSLWGELVSSATGRVLRVVRKPLLLIPYVDQEETK